MLGADEVVCWVVTEDGEVAGLVVVETVPDVEVGMGKPEVVEMELIGTVVCETVFP